MTARPYKITDEERERRRQRLNKIRKSIEWTDERRAKQAQHMSEVAKEYNKKRAKAWQEFKKKEGK